MYDYNHFRVFKDTGCLHGCTRKKHFVVHSSAKYTISTEQRSWLPQGMDLVKCRGCQPVITYRETISLPQVAFPALTSHSVDHDVGSMWKRKETNMNLNHCQALSKPKLLTKLLYHYSRCTAMVSMINWTFWTSNCHCFSWNKGFQPCGSQLQIWKHK